MTPLLRRPKEIWGWILIYAATLCAYFPAIRGGILWNDSDYVTAPALRSLRGLGRIWFEMGATQQYYPVLHSAFWIEHRLWGDATAGYHLVNIFLHATSACLLVRVLRRLEVPGAYLAGLIFALHPVAAESVAWITEQKNTLSTVFYLWAALAYLRFDRDRDARSYLLGLGLFLIAALSKSVAATLPGALLVGLWFERGRLEWRRDAAPLLPWWALGGAVGLFTGWVERTYVGAQGGAFALSFVGRCLVAGRAAWFYLGKVLWPANLVFEYPRWTIDPSAAWQYLFPLAALALVASLWLIRGRTRGPLAAALFFLGSLFPVLGFFNVFGMVYAYVADHWQYLACIGIIAPAAAAWGQWARRPDPRFGRHLPKIAAAGALVALGVLTWRESGRYREIDAFYRAIIERNPQAFMAEANLGYDLEQAGKTAEAMAHFARALQINPDFDVARNNLGSALLQAGRLPEAIAEFEAAVRLQPGNFFAQSNLGLAEARVGRLPEAIGHWEEALRIRPDSAVVRLSLQDALLQTGESLAAAGRLPEAIGDYEEALRINPQDGEAEDKLGVALADTARAPEALGHLERALRLDPDNANTHDDAGIALARAGRFDEALAQFQEALRLDPGSADARRNIELVRRIAARGPENGP